MKRAAMLKTPLEDEDLDEDFQVRDVISLSFESAVRLNKDMRKAAKTLSTKELRYLVDSYYQAQEHRKRAAGQVRAMTADGEPNELVKWQYANAKMWENNIKLALGTYTDNHPVGQWMKSIKGIGPVISAGMLAHIDIEKAPTVGHIWSYAGLNPETKWGKGKKRPWNADLKRLCWLLGESFVKVQNRPGDIYGHLFAERKAIEIANNEAGKYSDQAAAKLRNFVIGKDTDAYSYYIRGLLPPAHIHERSKRWAVKIFLSHLQAVMYREHYHTEPPKPFAIAILGHAHEIAAPK